MEDIDKEKLRAFEQKMHDEGADGFADGPRPWETWDESGAQAPATGRHVWEGKARRIFKHAPVRRTLGDRILSGLAMIALAAMIVGIAGVYLTEEQPQTVAWTAIYPTPIPLPGQHRTEQLPVRAMRSAPVIADIETLPPPAAGSTARTIDTHAAEAPAGNMPSPAGSAAEPGDEVAPFAAISTATAAGDTPAWSPDTGGADIEIVEAPSALLLTSTTDASPDGSDDAAVFDIAGMEMDPELAMEIATAPAVDRDLEAAPEVDSGMSAPETAAGMAPAPTWADSDRHIAMAPASDLINRGTTTASVAAAGSTPPESGTAAAGLATAAEIETPQDSGADNTEPAAPAASTAAGADPAATLADETGRKASGETAAPAVAPPADSDKTAQDMPPSTGEDSPASDRAVVALVATEPVATAPSPAGGWVVNLASYTHEAMARRKLGEFQAKGVTGEIESTTINDRPMYRIRVTGFENSRAARASIASLEKTLGLKGVWISRR